MKKLRIEQVRVIYFRKKDLIERYRDLPIDLIKINHFGNYSIKDNILISKTELIIYTNDENVSKILCSRY